MTDAADLLADLEHGEATNTQAGTCKVCVMLDDLPEEARAPVRRALTGTIGRNRLADILSRHGYPISWRQIAKHQQGGHP